MNGFLAFHQPLWLLGLGVIPLLGARSWWGWSRRRREWQALGRPGRPSKPGEWAWMAVLASVFVALSRPGWGRMGGEDQQAGRDLVLAIDTSRSMGCEDALPDRLGAAVKSAESLVRAIGPERADRAAVVAFAGRAVVRCPLTENLGAVVDVLHRLRAGDVSPGGTDLGRTLAEGLEILDEPGDTKAKAIILFSDGEDHAGTWESALAEVEQAGVAVFSVSVGDSEEGAEVPDGSGGVVMWEGQPVRSRRVDEGLRTISEATGGRLFPAGRKPVDLAALARRISAPDLVAKRRVRTGDYPERFPVFLGLATGLGVWACRVPWRRARLLMIALALGGTSLAAVSTDARTAVNAGCQALERGDAEAALKAFERAIRDE
ncbi:MAG TPA: VWA domain-containing protein, partial [Isosphaeraceae bacterium]|nr:VWA domain-containing protein [Isosphaeraceae bacterium]